MDISTIKNHVASLSATQVTKKLIGNIIKYAILCVILGLSINRGMTLWQRSFFSQQRWIWPIVIVFFLLLFPILYLWEIKTLATVDTVGFLRGTYRDDLVHIIIDKCIIMGQQAGNKVAVTQPFQRAKTLSAQFPGVVKRVINYCMQSFPLLQKLPEAFSGVDLSNPDTGAIKQTILAKLQPYMGDTQTKPSFGYGLWKLLAWNIVLRGVLYTMLHYA